MKTFGESGATCRKELTDQEAGALVKTTAALIASQEGLDAKHGITAPELADIFIQIFGEMNKVIAGRRSLYTPRKV